MLFYVIFAIYTNIQRQNTTSNARILTPPAEISCNQHSGMPAQRESARFNAETTDSTPKVKSNAKEIQRQNLAVKTRPVLRVLYGTAYCTVLRTTRYCVLYGVMAGE